MRPTMDTPAHQERRLKLVEEIRAKGIDDENVLGGIANIPRHFFMSREQDDMAYEDKAFPIGDGQTISQPYTAVAYQTALLQVQPPDNGLESGTGSAYQAAVLAEMGADVFTIERQKKLFDRNRHFQFLRHYPNLQFFYGDGYEGLPRYAPFDRILLTAAAPQIPQALVQQLKTGGMLVLPFGEHGESQRMIRLTKLAGGEVKEERFGAFSFVPMLKGRQE